MRKRIELNTSKQSVWALVQVGDVIVDMPQGEPGTWRTIVVERDVPDWEPDGEGWVLLHENSARPAGHELVAHYSADEPGRAVVRRWSRPA